MLDGPRQGTLRPSRVLGCAGVRPWPLLALVVLTCGLALASARPTGDGGEYLLEAHAFESHGTPEIRLEDARWLRKRVPSLRGVARSLERGLESASETPLSSVRRDVSGLYYSIHFWFYSLLAAPFVALTELAGASPALALGMLNGLAASAALFALWEHFERTRFALLAAVLFLLAGTTFYLGWTGPEILTGAATVIACARARRGDLPGAMLAGALASVQNASAGALLPFAVWTWWPGRQPLSRHQIAACVAAVALAALPYAFYLAHYRIPSLTGHFATDARLIGSERAWSFVFDLNQGLILGLPGILAAAVAAPFVAAASGIERQLLLRELAGTLALVTAMAVPTLSVYNWNAGESVIMRYGYWVASPLLVMVLELTARFEHRVRNAFALAVAALQLAAIAPNGLLGERSSYLRHSWAAGMVLRHLPGAYNPVREIFFERSLGRESSPGTAAVVAWPHHHPRKALVDRSRPARSAELCADGGIASSEAVHEAGDGWVYLDAPFLCSRGAP